MNKDNNKIGLGSLSLLICIMGILFAFSFGNKGCFGDVIIKFIGLKAWSHGDRGVHYTIFYSLIFFIPSVIVGYKFKNNLGATIGKIVSSIIVIIILVSISGLIV